MKAVDNYFGKIYYISSTLTNPTTPKDLKSTLKTDAGKCMAIGAVFFTACRYMTFKRYYLLKNYINSFLLGSFFGLGYSPIFLGAKIDQYRLTLLLEEDP
jgi:hypothetical protein